MRRREPADDLLARDEGVARHLRRAGQLAVPVALLTVAQAFALAALVVALAQDGRFDAVAAAVLLAAASGRGLLSWWLERSGRRAAAGAIDRLRGRIVADAATLAAASPGALRPGEIAADVVQQLPSIESYVGRFLSGRPAAAATTVVVLIAVASTDLLSAALLAPTVPVLIVFLWLVGTEARAAADARLASMQLLGAHLLDVIRGRRDLRSFGRAEHQREQVRAAAANYRVQTMGTLRAAFLSGLVLELVAMLGTALVAVFGGVRLAGGHADLAAILPALVLAPELYAPLRRLGAGYHEAADAKAALGRLAAVETLAAGAPVAGTPGAPSSPRPGGRMILLEGVTVAGGERGDRLRDVWLTIQPGETVALVGPSGSGKTTLASLVLGLLPPTTGELRTSGPAGSIDLQELDLTAWRQGSAWVAQDPILLPSTLRENARLSASNASDDAIEAALTAAGLGPLLEALPDGLETPLGEGGAQLSSGELRRLALARAVLANAELIVLDEPTAQVDALTAERLKGTIDAMCAGRTTLLITHDLELASAADRIVHLRDGQITDIEGGSGAPRPLLSVVPTGATSVGAVAHGEAAALTLAPASGSVQTHADEAPSLGTADGPSRASQQPTSLRSALRLLAPSRDRRARRLVRRAIGLGALSALSAVAVLALSGGLIVEASTRPPVLELTAIIVLVRMFSILRSTARYGERLAGHDAALRILEGVRVQVFAHVVRPGSRLDADAPAAVLDRAVGDVDRTADLLVRVVVPGAAAIVTGLVATVVAAIFAPAAAVAIVVVMVATGIGVGVAGLRAGRHQADAAAERATLAADVVTALDAATELLLAGRTDAHQAQIANQSQVLERASARQGASGAAIGAVVAVAAAAASVLVAALLAGDVHGGALGGAFAAGLVLAALATIERLDGIGDAALALPAATDAVGRLSGALTEANATDGVAEPAGSGAVASPASALSDQPENDATLTPARQVAPLPKASASAKSSSSPHLLRADGLSLRRGGRPVLRGTSLTVEPGEHVAITGESGCGKSTLLLVLAGLLPADAGDVVMGDLDLLAASDAARAEQLLLVPSRPHLFGGSLAANLRIAQPTGSDDDLWEALDAVGLGDWARTLPDGLQTQLGEGGATASGGQRQRIGLARAYLSPVAMLLLDEPASHLPEDAALDALRAVIDARPHRSAVIVSHRPAECGLADRELRMDHGVLHEVPQPAARQTEVV